MKHFRKFDQNARLASTALLLDFSLINTQVSCKVATTRLYPKPSSPVNLCQYTCTLSWQHSEGRFERALKGSAHYTFFRRKTHSFSQDLDLDQKSKDIKKGWQYKKIALASFSLSILVWIIVNKYVRQNQHEPIFNPPMFTSFEVIEKEIISPTAFLLTLRSSQEDQNLRDTDPFREWWERGIWSVEAKQPELQIARSYTPLPPLRGEPLDHIRFLIRREYKGEMSGYLDRLEKSSKVQLRGPHLELEIPETVNQVVFFAGGTGISPALQVTHQLLERRKLKDTKPSIQIVWANRRREDCQDVNVKENSVKGTSFSRLENDLHPNPIVEYFQRIQQQYPDQLTFQHLVDEEGAVLTPKVVSKLIHKEPDKVIPEISQLHPQSRLILISGPEGFIEFIAGAKKWQGIQSDQGQGELGGILKKLDLKDWGVWKL